MVGWTRVPRARPRWIGDNEPSHRLSRKDGGGYGVPVESWYEKKPTVLDGADSAAHTTAAATSRHPISNANATWALVSFIWAFHEGA
jgi:hypothetical protein